MDTTETARETAERRQASEKLRELSRHGYRMDIRFVDSDVIVQAFDSTGRVRATTTMPQRYVSTAIVDAYIALDVNATALRGETEERRL